MADAAEILADLNAESADLDRLVAGLPAPAWATRDAGRRVDDRASDRPPHLDRRGGRSGGAGSGRIRRPCGGAAADPDSFVDRGAARTWSPSRPRCCAGGGPAGPRSRTDSPAYRAEPRFPGTAPRCRRLRWRLPASWRPGPTGSTWPTLLGWTGNPPPGSRHIAHLGHRTFGFSFLAHGQLDAGRSCAARTVRTGRFRSGTFGRRRRRTG